jgi:hypothetical protein
LFCRVDPTQARRLLRRFPNENSRPEEITEEEQDCLEAEMYMQERADAIEDVGQAHTE